MKAVGGEIKRRKRKKKAITRNREEARKNNGKSGKVRAMKKGGNERKKG